MTHSVKRNFKAQPVSQQLQSTRSYRNRQSLTIESPFTALKDPNTYHEMRYDSTIRKNIDIKLDLIFSHDWRMKPFADEPIYIENAKIIEKNLRNLKLPAEPGLDLGMTQSIIDVLRDLAKDKMWAGKGVAEKNWEFDYAGIPTGKLESFIMADPFKISFKMNRFNKLESVHYNEFVSTASSKVQIPSKLVYYINNFRSSFNGEPDLAACYLDWYSKKHVRRMLNLHIQNRAWGAIVNEHPDTYSGSPELEAHLARLAALHEDGLISIPKQKNDSGSWEPVFSFKHLDLGSANSAIFKTVFEMYDLMIGRAMLIPDTYMQQQGVGAYDMTESHVNSLFVHIDRLRNEMLRDTQGQIISDFYKYNDTWDARVKQNHSEFEFMRRESVSKEKIDIIVQLKNAGYKLDPEWIKNWVGMPIEYADLPGQTAPKPAGIFGIVKPEIMEEKKPFQILRRKGTFAKYDNRIDFTKMEKKFDDLTGLAMEEMLVAIKDIKDKLRDYVNKKVLNPNSDGHKAIENLPVNVKDIKFSFNKLMLRAYFEGKLSVIAETKKAGYDVKEHFALKEKYGERYSFNMNLYAETDDDFGLTKSWIKDWIEKYGINLSKADLLSIERIVIQSKVLAGVIKSDLTESCQKILLESYGKKLPPDIAIQMVMDVFNKYEETGSHDGQSPDPYRMQALVETYNTDQFNTGRNNLILDPDLAGVYKAAQYIAIMDSVTTLFCRAHNYQFVEIADQRFLTNTPPNHYRCRSLWLYLLSDESYNVTWTKLPERIGLKLYETDIKKLTEILLTLYGITNVK